MIVLNNIITIISTIDIKYLVESVLFAKFSRAFLLKKPLVHCYCLDCIWIGDSLQHESQSTHKSNGIVILKCILLNMLDVVNVSRCLSAFYTNYFKQITNSVIHPDYLCFFSKKLFNFINFFCQLNILYYIINTQSTRFNYTL